MNEVRDDQIVHYGIRGMKWGVRRYQNDDGSLTSAGKKRYNPTKMDEVRFGKKGAKRIADRRNKGYSRSSAVRKEVGSRLLKIGAITAVGTAAYYGIISGKAGKIVRAGKQAIDSYNNISILDSSGKVIKKYHSAIQVGEEITSALMRR